MPSNGEIRPTIYKNPQAMEKMSKAIRRRLGKEEKRPIVNKNTQASEKFVQQSLKTILATSYIDATTLRYEPLISLHGVTFDDGRKRVVRISITRE